MKLVWQRRLTTGDWVSGSGWGEFRIQHSRKSKKWFLMLGSASWSLPRSMMDKYPTVIGSFDSRKEAQERAQMMTDELDATKAARKSAQRLDEDE